MTQGQPGHALDRNIYVNGEYLARTPAWHVDEAPFKVPQVLKMLAAHRLTPRTVGDIGCGAGEVLRLLQESLDPACRFWGYDISPQAVAMGQGRANDRLQFKVADVCDDDHVPFDLVLALDVIEHVPDYFGLLEAIRGKGELKIFHIPLDLSVQSVLRRHALGKRRHLHGHLHYFTRETALATLTEVGYEILDHFFTPHGVVVAEGTLQKLARLPRRLGFALHRELTARILGGYSLLVLAR